MRKIALELALFLQVLLPQWSWTHAISLSTHEISRRNSFTRTQTNFLDSWILGENEKVQSSDLTRLNDFMEGLIIYIPSIQTNEDTPCNPLEDTLVIKDLTCSNFRVDHLAFMFEMKNTQNALIGIGASGMSVDCTFSWNIESESILVNFPIFSPKIGQVNLELRKVSFDGSFLFASDDFQSTPPSKVEVNSCKINFVMKNIDITGSLGLEIADGLINILKDMVTVILEQGTCFFLSCMGSEYITSFLEALINELEQRSTETINPLSFQQSLSQNDEANLVDFTNMECSFSEKIMNYFIFINDVIGRNQASHDGKFDIGINHLIRTSLLDKDGVVTIDFKHLLLHDFVMLNSQYASVNYHIVISKIRIGGLDSFRRLSLVEIIDAQTLTNTFDLNNFKMEVELKLVIESENPTVLQDSTTIILPYREEEFTLRTEINGVQGLIGVFIGLDRKATRGMVLSSFLHSQCALNFISQFAITQFDVNFDNISNFKFEGLISPEFDTLINDAVESLSVMYSLNHNLPIIVRTIGRDILNVAVNKRLQNFSKISCSEVYTDGNSLFVDFSELFMNVTQTDGCISGRYGNVLPYLISTINMNLQNPSVVSTLFPTLSEIIYLRPEIMLGCTTVLDFQPKDEIPAVSSAFAMSSTTLPITTKLNIRTLKVENLNTMSHPTVLMQSNESDPHVIYNEITFGRSKPLKVSVEIATVLSMGNANIRNDFKLNLRLYGAHFSMSVLAQIKEKAFLEFPIQDIFNPYCWAAAFVPFPGVYNSSSFEKYDPSIAVKNLFVEAQEAMIDLECLSCDTKGFNEIPDMLEMLKNLGAHDMIISGISSFLKELLLSSDFHGILNTFLNQSPVFCPHHQDFNPKSTSILFDSMDCTEWFFLPTLSETSVETLVFLSGLIIQSLMVIAPMSLTGNDIQLDDPLAMQSSNDVIKSPHWKDLYDFANLSALNSLLKMEIDDQNKVDRLDLMINSLIRSYVLDFDGTLSILTSPLSYSQSNLELTLETIKISGLDSFLMLDALKILGPQTLSSAMGINKIQINLEVGVSIDSEKQKKENISIILVLNNVEVDIAFFLAVNEEKLNDLTLGSFLDLSSVMPCLVSLVDMLNVTYLDVAVENHEIQIDAPGLLSTEKQEVLRAFKNELKRYDTKMTTAMLGVGGTIKYFLNGLISSYILGRVEICESLLIDDRNDVIDLRDLLLNPNEAKEAGGSGLTPYGDVPYILFDFFDKILSLENDDGTLKLNNNIIGPLTKLFFGETGTFVKSGPFFEYLFILNAIRDKDIKTYIYSELFDLRIDNLDSIAYLKEFIVPQHGKGNIIDVQASLGFFGDPLSLATGYVLDIENIQDEAFNNFLVKSHIKELVFSGSFLVEINTTAFTTLPIKDISNPFCWLSTIPVRKLNDFGVAVDQNVSANFALHSFGVSARDVNVRLECITCSGPLFGDLSNNLSSLDSSRLIATLISNLDQLIQIPGIAMFIQYIIDIFFTEAKIRCNESSPSLSATKYSRFKTPEPTSTEIQQLIFTLIPTSIVIFCLWVLLFYLRSRVRSKTEKYTSSLDHNELLAIEEELNEKKRTEARINELSYSLLRDRNIPILVRGIVPLLIIGNIALFLSAHVNAAGSIDVFIVIGGETIDIYDYYQFNFIDAVSDMWTSGLKPMAIIVSVCSLIWPYVKQSISLLLWVLPTKFVSVEKRLSLYIFLDKLAKWSIIDIFVLVIFLSVFWINVNTAGVELLPNGFISLRIMLRNQWGNYSNLIAQMISQLSSHVIIYYNKKVIRNATNIFQCEIESKLFLKDSEQSRKPKVQIAKETEDETFETSGNSVDGRSRKKYLNRKEICTYICCNGKLDIASDDSNCCDMYSLCNEAFKLHQWDNGNFGKVHRHVNIGIFMFGMLLFAMLIVGLILPTYNFHTRGFVGLAIKATQGQNATVFSYNIFSLFTLMLEQGKVMNSGMHLFGLICISLLLMLSTFCVGCALIVLLFLIWFYPLTREMRKLLVDLVEILQSWQYIEVYILSVLVGLSQIQSVINGMSDTICGVFQEFFEVLAHFEIVGEQDCACLVMETYLDIGIFVLITVSILMTVFKDFVLSAHAQLMEDDIEKPGFKRKLIGSINAPSETIVKFTDKYQWCFEFIGERNKPVNDDDEIVND